jgi:hypothetical protein
MSRWDLAPSVAFTALLEFPWYAKADTRITGGISSFLVEEWKRRVNAGSTIDCFTLAREIEEELYALQCANATELGLPWMERTT